MNKTFNDFLDHENEGVRSLTLEEGMTPLPRTPPPQRIRVAGGRTLEPRRL